MQIVFMGEIMVLNKSATTVMYKVDDCTGPSGWMCAGG